ncbi:SDR family oxidoreductase, partial [Nocardiopsis tropica]|nr:SDR family oxidoreductase [Nocardiopsis tropica]
LGLALAEHLASDGARIVLTSRTGLPPAEEWGAWLDAGTGDRRTTEIVHRLKRLRDRGAQLLVVRADVTDRDAMRAVVDEAVRRWGGVHTVFHAAGLAGGVLMGIGARRAGGCNIGAYLAGIGSGSLHGWLWAVFALAGTWAGLRARTLFGLGVPKPSDSVC